MVRRTSQRLEGRQERLKALGEAVRTLRQERNLAQIELAELFGGSVPQTTVSRWEKGMVDLTCEQVYGLENALEVPHGTLGRVAGYVHVDEQNTDVTLLIRHTVHPYYATDAVNDYMKYQRFGDYLAELENLLRRRGAT